MFFSMIKKNLFLILITLLSVVLANSFAYRKIVESAKSSQLEKQMTLDAQITQNPTINLFDYAVISGPSNLKETLYTFNYFQANQYKNFERINFLLKDIDLYEDVFNISWNGNVTSTSISLLKDNDFVLNLNELFLGFDFTQTYDVLNAPRIEISLTRKDMQVVTIGFWYFTTSYTPVLSQLEYKIIDNKIQVIVDVLFQEDIATFYLFQDGVDITNEDYVEMNVSAINNQMSQVTFTIDYGETFDQLKFVNFFIKISWNNGFAVSNEEINSDVLYVDLQAIVAKKTKIKIIIGSTIGGFLLLLIIIGLIFFFIKRLKNKKQKETT